MMDAMNSTATLVLYTHPDCSYSSAAKEELDQQQAAYHEIDVTIHPEAVAELMRLTGGERITPVIVEGEKVTVGFRGGG